jgi:ribosomal protein L7/L12
MKEVFFNIRFLDIQDGISIEEVHHNLSDLVNKKIHNFLEEKNKVIKHHVTRQQAEKLDRILTKAGIICEIEADETYIDHFHDDLLDSSQIQASSNERSHEAIEILQKQFPVSVPERLINKTGLSCQFFSCLLFITLLCLSAFCHQKTYYRISSKSIQLMKKNQVSLQIIDKISSTLTREYKTKDELINILEKINRAPLNPYQKLWLFQYIDNAAVFDLTMDFFDEIKKIVHIKYESNIPYLLNQKYTDEEELLKSVTTVLGFGKVITYASNISEIAHHFTVFQINENLIRLLAGGPNFETIIKRTRWIVGKGYLIKDEFVDSLNAVLDEQLTREEQKKIVRSALNLTDFSNWYEKTFTMQVIQMPLLITFLVFCWHALIKMFTNVLLSYRSMLSKSREEYPLFIKGMMVSKDSHEWVVLCLGAIFGWILFNPFKYGNSPLFFYLIIVESLFFGLAFWYIYKFSCCIALHRKLNNKQLNINILKPMVLESVAQWSLGISLFIIGLISLSIFTTPFADNRYQILFLLLLWGNMCTFFLSMWSTHQAMKRAKNDELKRIGQKTKSIYEMFNASVDRNEFDDIDKLSCTLTHILGYEKRIREAQVWPHNFSTIRKLIASILLPIILSFRDKIVVIFNEWAQYLVF